MIAFNELGCGLCRTGVKYFAYFSRTETFQKQIKTSISSGKISAINAKGLSKVIIPIPPLDVQAKIVRILDAFTAITAELNNREKQYQYYRDKLLTFSDDEVEWKKLGDLGIIKRGKRVIKSQLNAESNFPVYQNSLQPLGYFDSSNVEAHTTFMITAGAAGEIGYSDRAFWAADDCYYFNCSNNFLNAKFLFHSLMKQQPRIFSQVRKASVPRLGRNSIENISIAIPPITEQKRIVEILDKFEALTHSITEGLPKEIALRQQQYEYYREQLLDFPKN